MSDDIDGALERSLALIESVAKRERERCAEELREMAAEFPHAIRIAFRIAADRLVGG
jgi:hypothetical protein